MVLGSYWQLVRRRTGSFGKCLWWWMHLVDGVGDCGQSGRPCAGGVGERFRSGRTTRNSRNGNKVNVGNAHQNG